MCLEWGHPTNAKLTKSTLCQPIVPISRANTMQKLQDCQSLLLVKSKVADNAQISTKLEFLISPEGQKLVT